jgi:hypothetical protein
MGNLNLGLDLDLVVDADFDLDHSAPGEQSQLLHL